MALRCGVTLRRLKVERSALFDHLVGSREVISYRVAYEWVFGPLAERWLNRKHTPRVLIWAEAGAWKSFGTISVRLDALIVDAEKREPAGGHFRSHGYTREQWRAQFGAWSLCKHSLANLRG